MHKYLKPSLEFKIVDQDGIQGILLFILILMVSEIFNNLERERERERDQIVRNLGFEPRIEYKFHMIKHSLNHPLWR